MNAKTYEILMGDVLMHNRINGTSYDINVRGVCFWLDNSHFEGEQWVEDGICICHWDDDAEYATDVLWAIFEELEEVWE